VWLARPAGTSLVWLSALADPVLAVNDQDLLAAVAFAIAGTRIAQSFARPGYGICSTTSVRSRLSVVLMAGTLPTWPTACNPHL
jgi:hypothetical protein